MSRVAVVLFALFTCACFAPGVVVEDRHGDPIYLEITDMTTCSTGNCHAACPEGHECIFSCSGGGCTQLCGDYSSCRFTCSGGGCDQRCGIESECTMSCSGGGCLQACAQEFGCSRL